MRDLTLIIFIIAYAGLAAGSLPGLRLDRTGIALVGGVAMLATGAISLDKAVASVNIPAILLLFSLMVIASQLQFAGFYGKIADLIAHAVKRPAAFLALLMGSTALLSALLSNSVVGLAFTPVVALSLKRRRLNPIPFLVAMVMSCNIGCGLTTIGNAQNVVLAAVAGIDFGGYILFAVCPVVLALTASWLLIWLLARGHFTEKAPVPDETDDPAMQILDYPFKWWRTVKGVGAILAVTVLFFTPLPHHLVALAAAALLLCSRKLASRRVLAGVDMQVLLLFIALFVLVGAFSNQGWDQALARKLTSWNFDLKSPVQLALTAGVLSNLISNAAAVLLLSGIVDFGANPFLGQVLALSNTFAGNLLLIGSMTSLLVVQTAAANGVEIKTKEFLRYSIPTALASFTILLVWIKIATF